MITRRKRRAIAVCAVAIAIAGASGCNNAPQSSAPVAAPLADAIRSGDAARARTFPAAERVKALEHAAQIDDEPAVKALLAAGTDAQSGMWMAGQFGRTAIARMLLDAGADPLDRESLVPAATGVSKDGATLALLLDRAGDRLPKRTRDDLLYEAASIGNIATVRLLLERGADPTATYTTGKTPVQIAREQKHFEVVEALNQATAKRQP